MRALIRRYPLAAFVVIAYGVSWSFWIPLAVRGARVTPGGATTHFPGLLGPAVAAFVVTALLDGAPGVRALARRMIAVSHPRPRFWLFALSPLGFLVLAFVVIAAVGAPTPSAQSFATYSGLRVLPLPLVVLLVLVFNGYGEETGWRGFALVRAQQRFGVLRGTFVVAAMWAVWHVPSFWFVEGYRAMGVGGLIGGFGLGLCAGSIVLAHVAHGTRGSVLAPALWHAAYNMTSATAAGRGTIGAVTTTCVMVWATIALVRHARGAQLLDARV